MIPLIELVGLDFRTAAIEIREHLALSGCELESALQHLRGEAPVDGERSIDAQEAVILSTCNRLEFYLITANCEQGRVAVERYMRDSHGITAERLRPHLYCKSGEAAVEHLLRVAAGLESMILGEPQILGQVGRAYDEARAAHTTGPLLSHLFAQAQHCGKRARTETAIGCHTVSLSHAAADLIVGHNCEGFPTVQVPPGPVLLVGAGEMAELAARALRDHGVTDLIFINRTIAGAERLARRFGGRARPWAELPQHLTDVSAVVTATGAPHVVITYEQVAACLHQRDGTPLLLADLALPRDVEPRVAELPGVMCYDLDVLNATLNENRARRAADSPAVEAIVAEETEATLSWLRSRAAVPTLMQLKEKAARVADMEMARTLRRIGVQDPRVADELSCMTHRIVNKLLHEPTVCLKARAAEGDGLLYRQTLRELFALEGEE